jgi:hypothetical protein
VGRPIGSPNREKPFNDALRIALRGAEPAFWVICPIRADSMLASRATSVADG